MNSNTESIISDGDRAILDRNEDVVKKYIVHRMQYAIVNRLKAIDLFTLGRNADDTAQITEKDYFKNLKSIMEYFVKSEQYEWAAFVKKLISYRDKQQVNDFLKDITDERK